MLGSNYNIIFTILEFRKYDVSTSLVVAVLFMSRSHNPFINIITTAHIRCRLENAYFSRNTQSLLHKYQSKVTEKRYSFPNQSLFNAK